MSTQTYKGSCHCGKLSFEANIDYEAGTARCNCTYCAKTRNWSAKIRPDAFKWLSGDQPLFMISNY